MCFMMVPIAILDLTYKPIRLFLPTPPYLLVPPHTKCENTVFSFFVPPSYIIRKIFLDLEVFFRFIKSETLFWIRNKPMDDIIWIYSGLYNPKVNLICRKNF